MLVQTCQIVTRTNCSSRVTVCGSRHEKNIATGQKADTVSDDRGDGTDFPALQVEDLKIGRALRETARQFTGNDALVFCESNTYRSWQQFDHEVDIIASGLLALGFERGDDFGVWATNVPEWVLLQYTTARIGVVVVTINPAYRASELTYALQRADLRGIGLIDQFRTSDYFVMLSECCPELVDADDEVVSSATFPKFLRVIALRAKQPAGILSWEDLLFAADNVSADQIVASESVPEPDDPINIQYTSGTTGSP